MNPRGKCRTQATSPANAHLPAAIIGRRGVIAAFVGLAAAFSLIAPPAVAAQTDPLPSWNEGPAKTAIIEFVKATTDTAGPKFVPPEARIATFDQDGTTWVEQPVYTQVMYCLDRVPALVEKKPELKTIEPSRPFCLAIGRQLGSSQKRIS